MQTDGLRIFFCIGAAKSGTTLLARVLDQHPDIACIWESYAFHPRASASIFNPASDSWQKHGFTHQDVQRWAAVWRAEPQAFLRRIVRRLTGRHILVVDPFRRTMSEALADFARRCNATIAGDKWPWYADYMQHVVAAFPRARFIHNVRDPRGLWNSAQRFKGRHRGDELLNRMIEQEQRIAPYLGSENSITVRYEDLVREPERISRQMFEFLGCNFRPTYLHYDPNTDPYPDRWDWVPEASEQFNRWHAVKWREQMDPAQIARVTRMAAAFIEKYGYEEQP